MLTTGPYIIQYIYYNILFLFTYFFKNEVLDRIKENLFKKKIYRYIYWLLLFFKEVGIVVLQKIHTLTYILFIFIQRIRYQSLYTILYLTIKYYGIKIRKYRLNHKIEYKYDMVV